MKKNLIRTTALAVISAALYLVACTQSTENHHDEGSMETHEHDSDAHEHDAESHDHDADSHDHDGDSEENHHQEGSSESIGLWKPSGDGSESINKDFHFIAGSIEDIAPQVVTNGQGEDVLELTVNGTPTAFVFHKTLGNVGVAVNLKTSDFKGTVKVIHHARNTENYGFVAVNGQKMTLGRIIDGKEVTFDEGDFSVENQDWLTLRVSAAGEHFKGYIGDKNVTHGHADSMKDGFVGIMTEGTGKLQISSIEVLSLEAE